MAPDPCELRQVVSLLRRRRGHPPLRPVPLHRRHPPRPQEPRLVFRARRRRPRARPLLVPPLRLGRQLRPQLQQRLGPRQQRPLWLGRHHPARPALCQQAGAEDRPPQCPAGLPRPRLAARPGQRPHRPQRRRHRRTPPGRHGSLAQRPRLRGHRGLQHHHARREGGRHEGLLFHRLERLQWPERRRRRPRRPPRRHRRQRRRRPPARPARHHLHRRRQAPGGRPELLHLRLLRSAGRRHLRRHAVAHRPGPQPRRPRPRSGRRLHHGDRPGLGVRRTPRVLRHGRHPPLGPVRRPHLSGSRAHEGQLRPLEPLVGPV